MRDKRKDSTKTEIARVSRGASPVHRALQAARKAAGFDTAAAAAAHFGWPVGRYRSHESGARSIFEDDFRRYAKAFEVAASHLRNPKPEVVARQFERALKATKGPKLEIARRLRCARILRGFPSAGAASQALGVATPTYLKHENGANGIQNEMLGYYSHELGISPNWLLTGGLPSGLGDSVDSRIRTIFRDPVKFAGLAKAPLKSSNQDEPPAALKTGRPAKTAGVPEYLWSDLEKNAGDIARTKPYGLVQFPNFPRSGFSGDGFFSILVDAADRQLRQYSRLFVTQSLNAFDRAEYLVFGGSDLAIAALDHSHLKNAGWIVGRVIGKLESPPGPLD
jgi:hypothetical protein